MPGLSDYLENKMTDGVLRGQTFTAPANIFFGLLVANKGARANTTAYALNDLVVVLATDALWHLYKVTTAGTTAGAQPGTYLGVANEVITDNTAVLTEQDASLDAVGSSLVEVTGGSYARFSLAAALANWSATQGGTGASTGTGGTSSNIAAIAFPTSSAAWAAAPAMVWGWGIWDALTVGNLLMWGPLSTPQNIGIGNTPTFAAGTATSIFA